MIDQIIYDNLLLIIIMIAILVQNSTGLVEFFFSKSNTKNFIFFLHSTITALLFFFASMMLENYISCYSVSTFPPKLINNFCLSSSTYSYESDLGRTFGYNTTYPGISPFNGQARVYRTYYNYVQVVLLIQGFFFIIPNLIWENQLIRETISEHVTNIKQPVTLRHDKVIKDVAKCIFANRHSYNRLYLIYCFTEILNLLNVILQFTFTNWLLSDKFTWYGWNALNN